MLRTLKPHPEFPSTQVTSIEIDLVRSGTRLELLYRLHGHIRDIRVPPPASPRRVDGLWQRTCFEAFLGTASGGPYYELNFSPSAEWAAYRLGTYRSQMSDATLAEPPAIRAHVGSDRLEVHVAVDLSGLAELPADGSWRMGLSAIVEETSGGRLFWALEHPPGEPDFHHKDCFALEVAAAAEP